MVGGFWVDEFLGGADHDVVRAAEGGGGDLEAAASLDHGKGSGLAGRNCFDGDLRGFSVVVEQDLFGRADHVVKVGV